MEEYHEELKTQGVIRKLLFLDSKEKRSSGISRKKQEWLEKLASGQESDSARRVLDRAPNSQ